MKTYWGFPVKENQADPTDSSKPQEAREQPPQQKGIALLMALLAIMMMIGFVADVLITSSVNLQLAVASRDRVRSEYLAKSGFNLGLFLTSVDWGIALFRSQPTAPPQFKAELTDSDESMWNSFNGLPPIGAAILNLANSFSGKTNESADGSDSGEGEDEKDPYKIKGMFGEENRKIMEMFADQFTLKIEDEGGKINLNDCSKGRCTHVMKQLTELFSCPAEKAFLQKKNLTPEKLAYLIKDFISGASASSPETTYADKNTPYEKDNYKTKAMPFDTLSELKLVAGWDDEMQAVFGPYLTIYPFNDPAKNQKSKININTIPPEALSCLLPTSRNEGCREKFIQTIAKKKKQKTKLADKDPTQVLKDLACYTGPSKDSNLAAASPADSSSGDDKDPAQWFGVKSSVFRLTIEAETGDQKRKLVAVIRRLLPKEKLEGSTPKRFRRSYEILYWRLI